MKKPAATPASGQAGSKRPGFTLVELLVAMAVGLLVLAAVASVLVTSLRMVNKNQQIDGAIGATRLVQEHINGEMAVAISMKSPLIRPLPSSPSPTTPTRYAVLTYRVPIGSYGTLQSDTPNTNNTLTVVCPSDVTPKVGDFCLMDSPNLDSGIQITGVSGSGTLTLSLASTIAAGTDISDTSGSTVKAGSLVRIQRQRQYATVPPNPSTNPVTELHWYESTVDSTYTVLSTNVDSNARYLFAVVPVDPNYPTVVAPEQSVSWQFSYLATGANTYSQGGKTSYYQANYAEGLIMPKSGDPLSATSIAGSNTWGTSTTLVSSTTTLGTSTTLLSTTTLGTSTTKVSSTTTLGTSTTKVSSTTTLGTSTTKVSSTTTLGTSSTKYSSTTLQSTTTLGTSSTKYSSTTLQSTTTTLGTSTTKLSTTLISSSTTLKSTTTLGTSTTKVSSTTTLGTSTTLVSSTTTLGTTTLGTSTTKQSTTTLGTSTTLVSSTTTLGTTTLGTSTTKLSTTTTTIPFDG